MAVSPWQRLTEGASTLLTFHIINIPLSSSPIRIPAAAALV